MLYRVLIVDDEKIVRIALKSMLDWGQPPRSTSSPPGCWCRITLSKISLRFMVSPFRLRPWRFAVT